MLCQEGKEKNFTKTPDLERGENFADRSLHDPPKRSILDLPATYRLLRSPAAWMPGQLLPFGLGLVFPRGSVTSFKNLFSEWPPQRDVCYVWPAQDQPLMRPAHF
jgi:hypothetical protein